MKVELITPSPLKRACACIREGGHTVGSGVVIETENNAAVFRRRHGG
jgi:translation elongation factor EF-Tu-like GTPase